MNDTHHKIKTYLTALLDTWEGLNMTDNKNPFDNLQRSAAEIEEIVIMVRLHLYNRDLPYGAQAIRRQLDDYIVRPLPSLSTINRILHRNGLTHRRTGHYR